MNLIESLTVLDHTSRLARRRRRLQLVGLLTVVPLAMAVAFWLVVEVTHQVWWAAVPQISYRGAYAICMTIVAASIALTAATARLYDKIGPYGILVLVPLIPAVLWLVIEVAHHVWWADMPQIRYWSAVWTCLAVATAFAVVAWTLRIVSKVTDRL